MVLIIASQQFLLPSYWMPIHFYIFLYLVLKFLLMYLTGTLCESDLCSLPSGKQSSTLTLQTVRPDAKMPWMWTTLVPPARAESGSQPSGSRVAIRLVLEWGFLKFYLWAYAHYCKHHLQLR